MKIRCKREELTAAVAGVSRAVAAKSSIPSIEGILFNVTENDITLTGYNLEMGITTTVGGKVEEPGDIVINAFLLLEMLRKTADEEVDIWTDSRSHIFFQCGIAQFNFSGIVASDFPALPTPDAEKALTILGAEIKEMLERTLFSAAQDNQKPVHTGIRFIIEDSLLTLVSVDGYRLSVCKKKISGGVNSSFVVPAKTLSEVSRLIGDDSEEVIISTAKRYAIFSLKKYNVVTRLLEGEFLDHVRAVPEGYTSRVKISVSPLYDAVERASLVIKDQTGSPVRIKFENSTAIISCATTIGKSYDEIDAGIEGNELEMGFNSRYIMDALRHCGTDEVYLEINEATSPMKIIPLEGDDFLFLVLPVRISI